MRETGKRKFTKTHRGNTILVKDAGSMRERGVCVGVRVCVCVKEKGRRTQISRAGR